MMGSTRCPSLLDSLTMNHIMSLNLSVPSIGCNACIETITKAIQAKDISAIVDGDPTSKTIQVESQLPESKIRELIAIAGHKVA